MPHQQGLAAADQMPNGSFKISISCTERHVERGKEELIKCIIEKSMPIILHTIRI